MLRNDNSPVHLLLKVMGAAMGHFLPFPPSLPSLRRMTFISVLRLEILTVLNLFQSTIQEKAKTKILQTYFSSCSAITYVSYCAAFLKDRNIFCFCLLKCFKKSRWSIHRPPLASKSSRLSANSYFFNKGNSLK